MLVNGLVLLLALAGILAAVAFHMSARAAKAALATREAGEAQLRSEIEVAQKAMTEVKSEAKEKREEASALRAELERTKKRAYEQQETAKKAGGAQTLREELDKVSGRLQEARSEAEHQRTRVKGLEQDLEKAREAGEKTREAMAQWKARAEAPPPAPVVVSAPPAAVMEGADPSKLKAETERADKAEAKLAEVRKKLAELERDLKGARGRLETEKRVYIVQKGELELAADRYAELRRRHDALRKDHDELVEAVRAAAREERRLTQQETARATTPTKPAPPAGEAEEPVAG
jgi:DNA repair exonuclease SbcCD ATPase subunit